MTYDLFTLVKVSVASSVRITSNAVKDPSVSEVRSVPRISILLSALLNVSVNTLIRGSSMVDDETDDKPQLMDANARNFHSDQSAASFELHLL